MKLETEIRNGILKKLPAYTKVKYIGKGVYGKQKYEIKTGMEGFKIRNAKESRTLIQFIGVRRQWLIKNVNLTCNAIEVAEKLIETL